MSNPRARAVCVAALLARLATAAAAQTPTMGLVGTAIPSPQATLSAPATLVVPTISWGVVANPANDAAIVTAAAYLANTSGQIAAQAKALQAGVDHMQAVLKWTDVEAALGVYDFAKVDALVNNSGTLPLVLNLAPIWDDGTTSLPAGLAFAAFSDAGVATAYQNMLTALQPHLRGRLYVLLVGNEVDTYLTTGSRRSQYSAFLAAVRTRARTLFGTNPLLVATTLRSSVVANWADWTGLDAVTDVNSFTYYPAIPLVSATFAATALSDLSAMSALGPMMFQELGVPSAGDSTEAFQAAAVQTLTGEIALLADVPGKHVPVVTWASLSDLSAAVIADFGYSSGQLTAGIGLRTTANAGKAAYAIWCGFLGGTNCADIPVVDPVCTFSLAASSGTLGAGAGSGTVALTASGGGCAWTRQVLDGAPSWVSVTPASGTGSATITYGVSANTGDASRSARFTIGDGDVFALTQAGATPPNPNPDGEAVPVCNSTTASPTGRAPIFGWTPCRQDKLNRMYSDYLANPTNPATLGGKLFKIFKTNADCNCRYADGGQYDALMFQAIGDTAYAAASYAVLEPRLQVVINLPQFDSNIPRDEMIRYLWIVDKLYGALTITQRDHLLDQIDQIFQRWVIDHSLRVGDSDEATATYFATVMLHLLFPNDARATTYYNLPVIGGLVPTKASSAVLTYQSDITARNGIRRFVEVMAAGGDWMEGASQYNYGTVQYLLEGTDAIKTATGVDYFPEVTAWVPQWGARLLSTMTPDLQQDYMWGDDQNAYQFVKSPFAMTLMKAAGVLSGTATARKLQGLYLDLVAKYGLAFQDASTMEIAVNIGDAVTLLYYDPYEVADDWKVSRSFFARGAGVTVQRGGFAPTDGFFMSHTMPHHIATTGPDVGRSDEVDHYSYYLGDWMFYKNGEWVISHPFGYASPHMISGEGGNGPLMHGIGTAEEYKAENLTASQSPTHTYVTGTTGGSLQQGDGNPNTSYLQSVFAQIAVHEWTRGLLYVPGTTETILVMDRANVTDLLDASKYPQTTAAHPDYYGFSTGLSLASANKKMFVLHTPVSPTIAGNDISWTSPLGQSVKWTSLLPVSSTKAIFNESTMSQGLGNCSTIYGCPAWAPNGNMFANVLKWHVKVSPTVSQQFDPFLNVVQVGAAGVVTLKQDNGGVGAHVTRPGQEDLLAIFNGQQGANLTLTPYDLTAHNTALATVRYRGIGYTIGWTAVASTTLVFLEDLDPNVAWTINKDGAGAGALLSCTMTPQTECLTANGEYRTTIAAAGAHTIVLVGSGSQPPPPPTSCPTITVTPTTLPNGTSGSVYSQTISASGGTAPYTFAVLSGTLPAGLTLASGGTLSGTPTSPGSYTFTVKATEPDLCIGSQSYTLVIDAPVVPGIGRIGTAQIFYDTSGSVSTLSASITMSASSSNRLALLGLLGGAADTLTSCTYAGAAMTVINKIQSPNDSWVYLLQLVNPATGANTLTCSFSANGVIAGIFQGYKGVHQTTPTQIGAGSDAPTYSASSTSTVSTTLTPTVADAWTVLMVRSWAAPDPGAGSSRVEEIDAFGMGLYDAGPHATANVQRTMEATLAFTSRAGAVLVALVPAP